MWLVAIILDRVGLEKNIQIVKLIGALEIASFIHLIQRPKPETLGEKIGFCDCELSLIIM